MANEIAAKTPNLCHLAPAGSTFMEDLDRAGGVYAVMKELADAGLLHTDVMTCTGKTMAENIAHADNLNPEIIRPMDNPYMATGGIAVLFGNLAPDGCVVKQAAVAPEMLVHTGPARVFDSRGGCHRRHLRRADQVRRRGGHPLRRPQGRPRYAGDAQPHLRHLRHGSGRERSAHHRRPVLRRNPRRVHRPCLP